ncbi:MAG: SH3 domain-containing protein [Roseinatronobacter sp.]
MAFLLSDPARKFRLLALAFLAVLVMATVSARAQVQQRAQPVTGAGVTTIGNIAENRSVNVRAGPTELFPVVGRLPYGSRVEMGTCVGGGRARWCRIDAFDGSVSGYVSGRYLVHGTARPPAASEDGGPDYWQVAGLGRGDRLNVRRDPSPNAPALATLAEGEIVQNLGCRLTTGARWCRVRSLTGMDVTGWVAARYLRESGGPRPVQPPITPPTGGHSGAHGPDFYIVHGLSAGDMLNIRAEPSAQSTVLGRLAQGARVHNLGCRSSGQTRWCRIETTGGVSVIGWVNGRYLREG